MRKCCNVIPELANSDHLGLSLSLSICEPSLNRENIKRKIWQYSAADFDCANELLDMIDWEEEVNPDDVNSSVLVWQSLFLDYGTQYSVYNYQGEKCVQLSR